jgi:hypothetical protein
MIDLIIRIGSIAGSIFALMFFGAIWGKKDRQLKEAINELENIEETEKRRNLRADVSDDNKLKFLQERFRD